MDGILNHGLYGKHGKLVLQKFLILYPLLILEFSRKAVSLDHQIILHIIQFIFKSSHLARPAYAVSEQHGQRLCHLGYVLRIPYDGHAAYGIQGIVKEMGINLALQGMNLRLGCQHLGGVFIFH